MNLQAFPAPPVLELMDVTYRRERAEIIRGVTFTVHPGEHWAMLGPNGAGKSTLLGFCGAVTHPTSGTVRVLGQQLGPTAHPPHLSQREIIGRCSDQIRAVLTPDDFWPLPRDTAREARRRA